MPAQVGVSDHLQEGMADVRAICSCCPGPEGGRVLCDLCNKQETNLNVVLHLFGSSSFFLPRAPRSALSAIGHQKESMSGQTEQGEKTESNCTALEEGCNEVSLRVMPASSDM